MTSAHPIQWCIVTGEYPPQNGGVSDYTRQVAEGLAACGDEVHVFAPPCEASSQASSAIQLHRVPDHFGSRGRQVVSEHLQAHPATRLLVQYVPHAFGQRAMNIGFCRWVRSVARRGLRLDVMFHEVAYPLAARQPLKHQLLALVNRQMARWLSDCADRIFVSILGWQDSLKTIGVQKPTRWLPVPSNVERIADSEAVTALRSTISCNQLIGHFGTYGSGLAAQLRSVLLPLAQRDGGRHFLLLGRSGDAFATAIQREFPPLAGRLHAPGILDSAALASHLAACDLMLQPYPDGISCRRSSAMAALALGMPVASCIGHLTEPLWSQSHAVALANTPAPSDIVPVVESVLRDQSELIRLRSAGRNLYLTHFDLRLTIEALRSVQTDFQG
jgi:glycosyltransferase involved in cell wall biosynthesis